MHKYVLFIIYNNNNKKQQLVSVSFSPIQFESLRNAEKTSEGIVRFTEYRQFRSEEPDIVFLPKCRF